MNKKLLIVALLGAVAVGLGAFGAHGLKPLLSGSQMDSFKTGSLYHFIHTIAMLALALYGSKSKVLNQSFYLFLVGIILFSGSIYLLSTRHLYGMEGLSVIGPITPLGGVLFIAGWLNLMRFKSDLES